MNANRNPRTRKTNMALALDLYGVKPMARKPRTKKTAAAIIRDLYGIKPSR